MCVFSIDNGDVVPICPRALAPYLSRVMLIYVRDVSHLVFAAIHQRLIALSRVNLSIIDSETAEKSGRRLRAFLHDLVDPGSSFP